MKTLPDLKITFLGTGTSQGVPVIACDCEVCTSLDPQDTRLRTAAMISVNGKNIVIDVGPDFRQQMLENKIVDIDSVLITHEHNDHVIGLDDVRPFNFRYQKDMPVYCTRQVINSLKKRFEYAFSENPYPGTPRFELIEVFAEKTFEVAGQPIIPFEVMHGKMPVLGFRFGDLTYITDAKTLDEIAIQKIKGTKILILNALRLEKHHAHLSLEEALDLIAAIQPQQAYLVHISHKMGLAASINKKLPKNVTLAYDGLQVVVK
ncbi:MAG: phosphoribosyl 1,2-cyclic phosphate phosphodiesterase [Saprospiraceae bacterium]